MEKQYRFIVEGYVQGVGYRWFTRENAQKFGLKGYVRNLANGNVEVVAEGREEDLILLHQKLKEGPSFSKVLQVKVEEFHAQNKYNNFSVSF